jgi:hypothetical protein
MPRASIHEKKIPSLPMKTTHTQPVAYRPTFFQTVKEGIALGVGSSIGHRIVGAVMGPLQYTPVKDTQHKENSKTQEYEQCMKVHDDKAVCERILLN